MGVTLAGNQQLSAASCIWGLSTLYRLHRIPFAPELLRQQFPPPYTQIIFQRAAEALGFRCGWRAVATVDIASLTLPWIALVKVSGVAEHPVPPSSTIRTLVPSVLGLRGR